MLGTAAGESNVTLNVVPKHVEAGPGETFIISIDADPGGNAVSSVRFDLSYDPSLLEGMSIDKGRFIGQDGIQTANPVSEIDGSGKVKYAETRIGGGVKNPGTVAVIKFRVKANAKAASEQSFAIENVTMTDDVQKELPAGLSGGDFKVSGEVQVLKLRKAEISRELSDEMNRTGDIEKIPVRIAVDSEQNLNDIVNFLNSRGTEASDVKQTAGSVTARATKRLIVEIGSMPFITEMTIYKEAPASERKVSGFGAIAALAVLLFITTKKIKINGGKYE